MSIGFREVFEKVCGRGSVVENAMSKKPVFRVRVF